MGGSIVDWPNERYVRIYTRDTPELALMPWEARCLFWDFYRRVDLAGVLDCGRYDPARSIATLCRVPEDVAVAALSAWLDEDMVQLHELGAQTYVVIPTFIDSQEASTSDKERKKKSRASRSAKARLGELTSVTKCPVAAPPRDDSSRGVTPAGVPVTERPESAENVTLKPNQLNQLSCSRAREPPTAAPGTDPRAIELGGAIATMRTFPDVIGDPVRYAEDNLLNVLDGHPGTTVADVLSALREAEHDAGPTPDPVQLRKLVRHYLSGVTKRVKRERSERRYARQREDDLPSASECGKAREMAAAVLKETAYD
jgi:hypothetical protein